MDLVLAWSRGLVPYRPYAGLSINSKAQLDLSAGVELETPIFGIGFRWGLGLGARRTEGEWTPAIRVDLSAAYAVGRRTEIHAGVSGIVFGNREVYTVDYRPLIGLRAFF